MRHIFWGVVVGGSLGLMESVIAIGFWGAFGMPQFLVRPSELELYMVMITTCGAIAGLVFGLILNGMAILCNLNMRLSALYVALILSSFIIYVVVYYLVFRFRILAISMVGDAGIFILGLKMARSYSNPRDIQ